MRKGQSQCQGGVRSLHKFMANSQWRRVPELSWQTAEEEAKRRRAVGMLEWIYHFGTEDSPAIMSCERAPQLHCSLRRSTTPSRSRATDITK